MLNPFYILIESIIFLIYGGLTYYIGLRGWQALFSAREISNSLFRQVTEHGDHQSALVILRKLWIL